MLKRYQVSETQGVFTNNAEVHCIQCRLDASHFNNT